MACLPPPPSFYNSNSSKSDRKGLRCILVRSLDFLLGGLGADAEDGEVLPVRMATAVRRPSARRMASTVRRHAASAATALAHFLLQRRWDGDLHMRDAQLDALLHMTNVMQKCYPIAHNLCSIHSVILPREFVLDTVLMP